MINRYTHCAVFIAVIVGLLLTACGDVSRRAPVSRDASAATEEPERIVIPVEASIPERGTISAYFETTTRIEADSHVEVNAEGSGRCVSVNFQEGDYVDKGDVLAELDKRDAEAQLQQTEVQVKQARVEYDRARQLLEADLIPPAEYDSARFNYENALANLRLQRLQLEHMTVKAPIKGIVTRRMVQDGMLVSSGMPVCEIVDPESFILHIDPPERELPRLEIGQIAHFTVDALGHREFRARVSRINPSVDRETGTIRVRLDVEPGNSRELRASAFSRVRLVMEDRENALLVPRDAVVEDNIRHYVFVVDTADADDLEIEEFGFESPLAIGQEEPEIPLIQDAPVLIARRVEVEIGLEDSEYYEIISGLDDDDLVITMGQRNLKPDSEIRVTNMDDELAAYAERSVLEALEAAEREHEARRRRSENPSNGPETEDPQPDNEGE